MAKQKRKKNEIRPWCWYCDREFEDEKVLTNHQKAKHFKCHICSKKMNTAGGLVVHVSQVHKETIVAIQNSLPGRESPTIEIYGMAGVPEKDLQTHLGSIEHQRDQTRNNALNIKNVDPEFIKRQVELFKQTKSTNPPDKFPDSSPIHQPPQPEVVHLNQVPNTTPPIGAVVGPDLGAPQIPITGPPPFHQMCFRLPTTSPSPACSPGVLGPIPVHPQGITPRDCEVPNPAPWMLATPLTSPVAPPFGPSQTVIPGMLPPSTYPTIPPTVPRPIPPLPNLGTTSNPAATLPQIRANQILLPIQPNHHVSPHPLQQQQQGSALGSQGKINTLGVSDLTVAVRRRIKEAPRIRIIYTDTQYSPEEHRAALPAYSLVT